mmetsp:Transcript_104628/g.180343  ORF Transcript_104628/g.180343 Transcript_104628/m.180343 type:complete len:225 (-) Transcript_104628:122-796(-)
MDGSIHPSYDHGDPPAPVYTPPVDQSARGQAAGPALGRGRDPAPCFWGGGPGAGLLVRHHRPCPSLWALAVGCRLESSGWGLRPPVLRPTPTDSQPTRGVASGAQPHTILTPASSLTRASAPTVAVPLIPGGANVPLCTATDPATGSDPHWQGGWGAGTRVTTHTTPAADAMGSTPIKSDRDPAVPVANRHSRHNRPTQAHLPPQTRNRPPWSPSPAGPPHCPA